MENNNQTQSHQLLHSFCLNPGVRVETQATNEQILLVIRAHPITQISWIMHIFILLILLIVINILSFSFFSIRQMFFLNLMVIIVLLSYAWFSFLSWYFNVGVITNSRIIDIDFASVIYKEVTEARLDKVEDITSKSGGYFESFFDYGNVHILTAAKEENIEFLNVPMPSEIVRIIGDLTGR